MFAAAEISPVQIALLLLPFWLRLSASVYVEA